MSISIIQPHLLCKDQIQPFKPLEIIGVNGGTSFTNGIYTSFSKFKFHVANINIKQDGILGYDYLQKNKAKLDLEKKTT